MGILYVARSPKLCRWASDVGLGKNIFKVGIAEGDPKPLAAAGWAGESDWTITRKQTVEGLSEDEAAARRSHTPARPPAAPPAVQAKPAPPAVAVAHPPVAAPRPEPRKIVPPVRQAPPIVSVPPSSPAIASRPPATPVVAKAPAGVVPSTRPAVSIVPPGGVTVVKPPAAPCRRRGRGSTVSCSVRRSDSRCSSASSAPIP